MAEMDEVRRKVEDIVNKSRGGKSSSDSRIGRVQPDGVPDGNLRLIGIGLAAAGVIAAAAAPPVSEIVGGIMRAASQAPDAFARVVYSLPGTLIRNEAIGLVDAVRFATGEAVNFQALANGTAGVGALVVLERTLHLPSRVARAGGELVGRAVTGVVKAMADSGNKGKKGDM